MGGGKTQLSFLRTCTLLIICALCAISCSNTHSAQASSIEFSEALFHNHDSLLYYAERAFLRDDPKGQYVLGASSYLRLQGNMPDSLYTLPLWEADFMLIRAAEQDYQPAIDLIRLLQANGEWHHEIIEIK